jgi:hypothetical protein
LDFRAGGYIAAADLIVTVSFDSFAEAEETGYVERGWIPDTFQSLREG